MTGLHCTASQHFVWEENPKWRCVDIFLSSLLKISKTIPSHFGSFLFVQLDVGKDGMNAPGFREHRAEGESEARHEDPGLDGADVSEGGLRGERRVEAEDDHSGVAEQTADYYQIIQIWRRHLDLSGNNFYTLVWQQRTQTNWKGVSKLKCFPSYFGFYKIKNNG